MKKSVVLLSFLLISSVVLSAMAYADNTGTSGMISSIGDIVNSIYDSGIQPLAGFLIGKDSAGDATKFFTLILMLVLLVSLLWEITERVPIIQNNSWVQFIVSFAVAVIAVRFLGQNGNSGWFETILLPNQALGIALLCIIPFVIYFFFVMDIGRSSSTLAKILWIFAAVLFAVLYFTRVNQIAASAGGFNPANIYLLAALACVVFLIFDGTVRKWYKKVALEKAQYKGHAYTRAHLTDLLETIKRNYSSNPTGYASIYDSSKPAGIKAYQHDLKEINTALTNLT